MVAQTSEWSFIAGDLHRTREAEYDASMQAKQLVTGVRRCGPRRALNVSRVSVALLAFVFLPTFVLADEVVAPNAFAPQKLESGTGEAVLERARFQEQDTRGRLQLDADLLRSFGAIPRLSLTVDNAVFYLTHPFSFYGGRQLALAFVEVDRETSVRILYRSNSQFSWRMCDATDGGHIGKGLHEFDKQVPIPVTVALLKLHDDLQVLNGPPGVESPSQAALSKLLLLGLTVYRRSKHCIANDDGSYYSREYAAFMPSEPMSFSQVDEWLATVNKSRVANPIGIRLPTQEQLPDLQKPIMSFTFSSPAYAAESNEDGELTGHVFPSVDATVRYLFFEDTSGRAVLSSVESVLPPVNTLGLRSRYLEVRGMDAPLIEYSLQIPVEFGGSKEPGYRSNWNYVRELPIIKYYYAEQDRTIPPPIVQPERE